MLVELADGAALDRRRGVARARSRPSRRPTWRPAGRRRDPRRLRRRRPRRRRRGLRVVDVDEVVERHARGDVPLRVLRLRARLRVPHRPRPALHLPRRATPRTRVPGRLGRHRRRVHAPCTRRRRRAAGTSSGAPTPALWDADRATRRRWSAPARRCGSCRPAMTLEVVAAGWATTIQDAGRPGFADIGVPTSGRARRRAAARCSTGSSATARTPPCWRRSAGYACGRPRRSSSATSADRAPRRSPPARRSTVDAGGRRRCGATSPCAAASPSSRCSARAAMTPVRARAAAVTTAPACRSAPIRARRSSSTRRRRGRGPTVVDVWPGPRVDWFVAGALDAARGDDVDRVRRTSAASAPASTDRRSRRRVDDELPSEGLVTGAVQVPPDGRPVVMLADHPTTGGYPVLAVVDPAVARRRGPGPPGHDAAVPRPTLTAGADTHLGVTTCQTVSASASSWRRSTKPVRTRRWPSSATSS